MLELYVQTLRHTVDEQQPFFKVLEPKRWKVLAVKNLLQRNAEMWRDTPC